MWFSLGVYVYTIFTKLLKHHNSYTLFRSFILELSAKMTILPPQLNNWTLTLMTVYASIFLEKYLLMCEQMTKFWKIPTHIGHDISNLFASHSWNAYMLPWKVILYADLRSAVFRHIQDRSICLFHVILSLHFVALLNKGF